MSDEPVPSISTGDEKLRGKLCPLCGKPNQCRHGSGTGCWCVGIPVSKEKLEAALGVFNDSQACLCPECLTRFTEASLGK